MAVSLTIRNNKTRLPFGLAVAFAQIVGCDYSIYYRLEIVNGKSLNFSIHYAQFLACKGAVIWIILL